MLGYPLPVTTFIQDQLNEIQKKFIFLLLPKLGMNRHTPRAIVYGPATYGGREILDLRILQPVQHIRHNLGHLRRGDNTGKALIITKRDTQLESGLPTQFYKWNPSEVNYVTKNTRWNYMWRVIFHYKIDIVFYNEWLPQLKYENDKNIMEVAIKDKKYTNTKNKWRLEIINNCRMYLGIINISDMVDKQGQMLMNYVTGNFNTQPKSEYNYPKIRKPPKPAWSEWKEFIYRSFINGKNKINPSLKNKLPIKKYDPHFSEMTIFETIDNNKNINTLITELPTQLRSILGKIHIPQDMGMYITRARKVGPIIAASDGSVCEKDNNSKGGYAYSIQRYNKNDNRIKGYASSPNSDTLSSFTTEMYGYLAILIVIRILEKQQGNSPIDDNELRIVIDNKEVIKKANIKPTPLNISETLSHDYDTFSVLRETKHRTKFTNKRKSNKHVDPVLNSTEDRYLKVGNKSNENR